MKYRLTIKFVDTEQEAIEFVEQRKAIRRKASYTPWSSSNGKEHAFVIWYYV